MNLLPLVKCKLQEQQAILKYLFLPAMLITIFISGMMWSGSEGSGSILSKQLGVFLIMIWIVLQVNTFAHWLGSGEFWYGLPYSKTQVFMVSLFVQQATILAVFFSCLAVPFLLGVVTWSSSIAIDLVDMVTCGTLLVMVLLCFLKPKENFIEKRRTIMMVAFGFMGMISVFLMALSPSLHLGLWPTYFALPAMVLALLALKRSLDNLEPITWERPLFQPDARCAGEALQSRAGNHMPAERQQSNPSCYPMAESALNVAVEAAFPAVGKVAASSNKIVYLSGSQYIAESNSERGLKSFGSPLTRYIAKTVWLNVLYIFFLFNALFLMLAFGMTKKGMGISFSLFFICLTGANIINFCNKPIRALVPLPIETSRLFLLVCAPYLVMITLCVILPFCFGFGEKNTDEFYVGLFARTSAFFFFLLGIRLACRGGAMPNISLKRPRQHFYLQGKKSSAKRGKRNWKQEAEQAFVWLGVGVLAVVWFDILGFGIISKHVDLKAFLLDHYLACWIVLIGVTALFYRLCLQAFRRVY